MNFHTNVRIQQTDRLTRRKFGQHILTLGVIGSSMGALLNACSSPTAATNLLWHSEEDGEGSFQYLTDQFNALHPDTQVQREVLTPGSSYDAHDDVIHHLLNNPYRPDIISLDVIWMQEFINKGWIEPLDTYWIPIPDRNNYLQVPRNAVEADGEIWAAPLHTDIGVLFYRTDLIATPPQTWDELQQMALAATASGKVQYGYVWQGRQYEGLVCNFLEVLSSFGGNIFDSRNPEKVVIYSTEAIQALQTMVNWIHGPDAISPQGVLNYDETNTTGQWDQGNAVFMRNWPSRIFWSDDASQTKIAEKFTVTRLPSKARSCLGGWQLAINKFSQHKAEAWEFIQWMLQSDAQKYLAVKEAFPVTLANVYDDPYIKGQNPFFSSLADILQSAQARPRLSYYPDVSNAIQTNIHQALAQPGQYPADTALQTLQHQLENIVAQNYGKS